jgi:hypothetical protein
LSTSGRCLPLGRVQRCRRLHRRSGVPRSDRALMRMYSDGYWTAREAAGLAGGCFDYEFSVDRTEITELTEQIQHRLARLGAVRYTQALEISDAIVAAMARLG